MLSCHFVLGHDAALESAPHSIKCDIITDVDVFEILEDVETKIRGIVISDFDENDRIFGVPGIFKIIITAQFGEISFTNSDGFPSVTERGKSVTLIETLNILNEILANIFYLPDSNYYGTYEKKIYFYDIFFFACVLLL